MTSVGFRRLAEYICRLFTGQNGGYVESFSHLGWEARLWLPAMGGAIAGGLLWLGARFTQKSSTDYMEAISLGDGIIPVRSSLVKSASALFSISSGASIGSEGPLVQLAAVIASLVGRLRHLPPLQLRLLVACGASAGIASAYKAPIGGALFVAEIILNSLAMESFGPLVFASVVATLTVRNFLGSDPLYEIDLTVNRTVSAWEIPPYLILGILAGLVAPWFLRLLRWSEHLFSSIPAPAFVRLGLGGLVVGALAIRSPEVCGNGYSTINEVIQGHFVWQALIVVLALKLLATAATFGSGAVGGVFTPTLFAGACLGELFGGLVHRVWLHSPAFSPAHTFALIGMGAFLAATTHAPLMAIIMIFELTLDYGIILPLMLACVVAHYTCSAFDKSSVYSESLKRKGADADAFQLALSTALVGDLMKADPIAVSENARFTEIAECFIRNRFNYLYVVDESRRFRGVISLHDVKGCLNDSNLAQFIIARDILRDTFPSLLPNDSLATALERFSRHDGERLPVVAQEDSQKLIGSISKSDLLLALAHQNRETQPAK